MKFTADKALIAAREIVDVLSDHCEKIEIAGSLRRRKPEVKDIEIVFVPRFQVVCNRQFDLFINPKPKNLAEEIILKLLDVGLIAKRLNVNGNEAWGPRNKLAIHVPSGIPVDLFTATPDNFYNYLVCRTGPTESNIRICKFAKAKGWKWNPYGDGFSQPPEYEGRTRIHICGSEQEVFELVGLAYKEPWER